MDFDQALVPGVLDFANWSWRYNNVRFNATDAAALSNRVTVNGTAGAADPGANVCSFSPPPFDVTNAALTPAPAFADYPIP